MRSIFEKIMDREIPAEILFEDEEIIAIRDIAPRAPIHLLIIPKKKIPCLQKMQEEDLYLVGKIVKTAQKLAQKLGLEKGGYRLLTNNGPHAGQTIDHLHFHLLGGAFLGDMA
jgi:histidine triad (HIT) family protein